MFLLFTASTSFAFGQPHTNPLPALAPPYGELPPTFWERHGPIVLTGVFIIVAVAGLLVWKLFQPAPPPPVLPPERLARQTLAQWLDRPEDGKTLSEISQVLRRYLAAGFAFPSGELTTAEFCAVLAGSKEIGADLAHTISAFLRECDARKFSPANPNTPMNAARRALDLVDWAEKVRNRRDAGSMQK